MDFYFLDFFLGNLEAAGAIGGYVSISIVGIGLITFATRKRIASSTQIGPGWAHPVIGALLGIIPGCGATIVVSSMYKNKKISFGGLFATFIATLGEGSFVLLGASDEADVAANLTAFLIVNVVGFVVGTGCGYVVDAIGIRKTAGEAADSVAEEEAEQSQPGPVVRAFIDKAGFCIMLVMAIFLLPGSIMALWGGEIAAIEGATAWVATVLTVFSIVYYLVYRFAYRQPCCTCTDSMGQTLVASFVDVALVVFYVFIGLFVANFLIDIVVGPERFDTWMTSSVYAVVVIATLIGAAPGCGGMIAVAVAYTAIPDFPIAALIAAAIATSGDGIFPLLASNKKDAVLVMVAGFGVALVVGYLALLIGI